MAHHQQAAEGLIMPRRQLMSVASEAVAQLPP